jgi:DNA-binding SARP family transcriptional activator/tetratricopeptide (TPR) repeat protein/DNA-binding XRE family transcriptional regulator
MAESYAERGTRAGTPLRALRHAAGLTQRDLADRAGVSIGVIRDLEQGKTRRVQAASAERLAAVLRVRPDQITASGSDGRRPEVYVSILGSLAVYCGSAPVAIGGLQQRAVLGLLAVHPDVGLHRDAIADMLWMDAPPATAIMVIQSYVSRLRHILDPQHAARSRDSLLVSDGRSYRLGICGDRLDLLVFRNLANQARTLAAQDPAAACGFYEQALSLWRGEPLADIPLVHDHPAVVELSRERATLALEYAAAASAAGWHDRVLVHLRALTAREPLNEQAAACLMTALAGSGQQAAALEVFEDARRRLADQLGLDPGPKLAEAHVRVLRGQVPCSAEQGPGANRVFTDRPGPPERASTELTAQSRRAADGSTAARRVPGKPTADDSPMAAGNRAGVMPRQLPPRVRHFVGRAAELKVLDGLLAGALDPGGAAGEVGVAAITGGAGVGKSALAVYWAHRVSSRFSDGQLYVDLGGYGPSREPGDAGEVIRGFLGALGMPPWQVPADPEELAGLYRSVLAGRRVLIVADNAKDAAQVRPLLPGSRTCLVVVTSRSRLGGLAAVDGAQMLMLDVFSEQEAVQFLTARLGAGRVAAEPECSDELIGWCARLPLALSITAARAAALPGFSLAALAGELRDARHRLDALEAGDPAASVRAVFSWSCQQLTGPAARMFRLLSVHPGPDITARGAAALAATSPVRARRALRELAQASLLTEPRAGRFGCHDLLRAYAAERAALAGDDRREAAGRMLDHYLHSASAAAARLNLSRSLLALPPPRPATAPERFADDTSALAWFDAEHRVLLAIISRAGPQAWQLAAALGPYLDGQGRWQAWHAVGHTALAAAQRHHDQAGQARIRRDLGLAQARLGCYQDAYRQLRAALRLYQQLGDRVGQARTHQDLARVADWQGNTTAALNHAVQLLELIRATGDQAAAARALNDVGWTHAQLGAYQQALDCCQHALAQTRQLHDRLGQAITWDSIGYIHHHLGRYPKAINCYTHALTIYRQLGNRYRQAETLTHLGDTHRATGNHPAARHAWQQALHISEELHHPHVEHIRNRLHDPDKTTLPAQQPHLRARPT